MKILAAATIFMLCLIALGTWIRHRPAAALGEGDAVLLAEFFNASGDPAFDGVLKPALAVQLQQSRFLNALGDDRISEALRAMGRAPDETVTDSLAPEVCRRTGTKALLGGSISWAGHYVIDMYAVDCGTGEVIVREQRNEDTREHALANLNAAAAGLLSRLRNGPAR